MMGRQQLIALLNKVTDTVEDQRWGRQLATIFERHAIALRLRHGGKTLLEGKSTYQPEDSDQAALDREHDEQQLWQAKKPDTLPAAPPVSVDTPPPADDLSLVPVRFAHCSDCDIFHVDEYLNGAVQCPRCGGALRTVVARIKFPVAVDRVAYRSDELISVGPS